MTVEQAETQTGKVGQSLADKWRASDCDRNRETDGRRTKSKLKDDRFISSYLSACR